MAIVVNRSVTSGELPLQIPDGAVTTAKIADSAVTGAKLAANSVTVSKISDGVITGAKINWSAIGVYHEYSDTGGDKTVSAWTQTTIKDISLTGLEQNATYVVLANTGLVYNKADETGDISVSITTPTTGATMNVPKSYSMSSVGMSRAMTGTLTTGSNTTVTGRFVLNAQRAGTYNIELYQVILIRVA